MSANTLQQIKNLERRGVSKHAPEMQGLKRVQEREQELEREARIRSRVTHTESEK